uniref:hypothetical protein n=1 Tax=Amycolatopsis sp. CA-096443 TaxID=3239919 RepID=UPI003F496C12
MTAGDTGRSVPAAEWVPEGSRRARDAGGRGAREFVNGTPLYALLVAKTVRLWPDQADTLKAVRYLLQGKRTRVDGARITDATVARLGVDLVDAFAGELEGDEEEELAVSARDLAADLLDARELLRLAVPEASEGVSAVEMVKMLVRKRHSEK